MILVSNLPRLKEISAASEKVLDVGGWHNPFNLATHVIDIMPYATRRSQEALDPENAERFTAAGRLEISPPQQSHWQEYKRSDDSR